MKIGKIIIFILIIAAFVAGVYFKDVAIKFFNNLNTQIKSFQKSNVVQTISKVGKEVFSPVPLNAGGANNKIILLQSKIITETNLQRQNNGNLPPLMENTKLDETAAAKANDMFLKQYFEHVSPLGVGPGDLAQQYGYSYIVEGENLILGNFSSEKEVVQDWMDSPGHRANILNDRYTEIGVAVVKGSYKGDTVWVGVQEFGLPLSACGQPNESLKKKIDSEETQLNAIYSQIDTEKNQIDSMSQNSPAYSQMVNDYNQMIAQYDLLAGTVQTDVLNYNNQVSSFNGCVQVK